MRTSTKTESQRARRRIATLVSSCLCTILGAVVLMNNEQPRGVSAREWQRINEIKRAARPYRASSGGRVFASVSAAAAAPTVAERSIVTSADISALSTKNLLIPVAGVASRQLHDSFYDSRSEGRIHKALDIMAPRDTPVLATDDGKVLKLHQSNRGGTMLYQSDASGSYVYYYGHLTRYADGISEGKQVRRGEIIAFVGDTGNAGAGNCHLHFGISRITEAGRWSGGEPINPYPILTGQPTGSSIEAGK